MKLYLLKPFLALYGLYTVIIFGYTRLVLSLWCWDTVIYSLLMEQDEAS